LTVNKKYDIEIFIVHMVAQQTLLCHVALLGSLHYKPNCYLYIKHFHCGALMQYIEHGSAQCTAMIVARQ